MTKIFISYSRQDKSAADRIASELRMRGADVFLDYQKLIAGENFTGRLGREIESSDVLLLLLSPRSVESKWVQAEVAWAMHHNKPIIPVMLEPASMTDFFFLINVEQVDFSRWSVDGNVTAAVRKLAQALDLPEDPITQTRWKLSALIPPQAAEGTNGSESHDHAPSFNRGDLSELFFKAVEIADDDPEQAIFLYRRVIEIDPAFMGGQALAFVEREEARLKPQWLANMLAQAETALRAGEWRHGERIGRDMLILDPTNADAERIVSICANNTECEPVYEQAVVAAQRASWRAAAGLLRHVRETCPDYGDPKRLLHDQRITPMWAEFLCDQHTFTEHNSYALSIAFSHDGRLLAAAMADSTIWLWDVASRRPRATLIGHEDAVLSVAFSPDNRLLASTSNDNTVRLWNVPRAAAHNTLTGHNSLGFGVAFSPDGKLLACALNDNTIRLWDIPAGTPRATLARHTSTVRSVDFSPDGLFLASGSNDTSIRLWNMPGGSQRSVLNGHLNAVFSVTFSPDGTRLASTSYDNTIRLWNMPDDLMPTVLHGHTKTVYSAAFSPDGTLLASVSADKTVRLWEVIGGRECVVLTGHSANVYSAAFSPDGKWLASASKDGTIKLWGVGS